MPLTEEQRDICRILARSRVEKGESYVAGGSALNELLRSPRISKDIDLFHDTSSAVLDSWESDNETLTAAGYEVRPLRELPYFVEAEVGRGTGGVLLQWAQDSAFRFFPLIEHPDFGLSLHPFDLATNKVLALVGRVEIRDWVDVIHCHGHLQPFVYMLWATCGKDPGINPEFILEHARRSTHYSGAEYQTLAFDGSPPDPELLCATWRGILRDTEQMLDILPEHEAGKCVMASNGGLFRGNAPELGNALRSRSIHFHEGAIRGVLPRISPYPMLRPDYCCASSRETTEQENTDAVSI